MYFMRTLAGTPGFSLGLPVLEAPCVAPDVSPSITMTPFMRPYNQCAQVSFALFYADVDTWMGKTETVTFSAACVISDMEIVRAPNADAVRRQKFLMARMALLDYIETCYATGERNGVPFRRIVRFLPES